MEGSNLCEECKKRCTVRKMVLTFLVQAGLKVAHAIKSVFNS